MKRKLLTLSTMLLVGIATAWADTSVITDGTDGWTKITSIPSNVGDYYFVFVDNTQDLMLSFGEGVNQSTNADYKTMVYRTSEDPAMNPAMLWTLEANGDKWGIRNVADPTYLMQTEYDWTNNSNTPWYWRTHDVASGTEWHWPIRMVHGLSRILIIRITLIISALGTPLLFLMVKRWLATRLHQQTLVISRFTLFLRLMSIGWPMPLSQNPLT